MKGLTSGLATFAEGLQEPQGFANMGGDACPPSRYCDEPGGRMLTPPRLHMRAITGLSFLDVDLDGLMKKAGDMGLPMLRRKVAYAIGSRFDKKTKEVITKIINSIEMKHLQKILKDLTTLRDQFNPESDEGGMPLDLLEKMLPEELREELEAQMEKLKVVVAARTIVFALEKMFGKISKEAREETITEVYHIVKKLKKLMKQAEETKANIEAKMNELIEKFKQKLSNPEDLFTKICANPNSFLKEEVLKELPGSQDSLQKILLKYFLPALVSKALKEGLKEDDAIAKDSLDQLRHTLSGLSTTHIMTMAELMVTSKVNLRDIRDIKEVVKFFQHVLPTKCEQITRLVIADKDAKKAKKEVTKADKQEAKKSVKEVKKSVKEVKKEARKSVKEVKKEVKEVKKEARQAVKEARKPKVVEVRKPTLEARLGFDLIQLRNGAKFVQILGVDSLVEKEGVKSGDILVEINGKPVPSKPEGVHKRLSSLGTETIRLTIRPPTAEESKEADEKLPLPTADEVARKAAAEKAAEEESAVVAVEEVAEDQAAKKAAAEAEDTEMVDVEAPEPPSRRSKAAVEAPAEAPAEAPRSPNYVALLREKSGSFTKAAASITSFLSSPEQVQVQVQDPGEHLVPIAAGKRATITARLTGGAGAAAAWYWSLADRDVDFSATFTPEDGGAPIIVAAERRHLAVDGEVDGRFALPAGCKAGELCLEFSNAHSYLRSKSVTCRVVLPEGASAPEVTFS
jgi:hypothetical protein